MNEKGFIASALLYGMLALFLVIMISTLYVLGNNKLSMDKLKENAFSDVNNKNYYVYAPDINRIRLYQYTKDGIDVSKTLDELISKIKEKQKWEIYG